MWRRGIKGRKLKMNEEEESEKGSMDGKEERKNVKYVNEGR